MLGEKLGMTQLSLFLCFLPPLTVSAALCAQTINRGSTAVKIDVKPEELLRKPTHRNWLSYNGDYTGQRHSALREITAKNVGSLRAQWVFHAPNSGSLEVTPVVVDGIMFVTSANDA